MRPAFASALILAVAVAVPRGVAAGGGPNQDQGSPQATQSRVTFLVSGMLKTRSGAT